MAINIHQNTFAACLSLADMSILFGTIAVFLRERAGRENRLQRRIYVVADFLHDKRNDSFDKRVIFLKAATNPPNYFA